MILFLSAIVFSACRFPRWWPWLFGLLLATKQHLILGVPAAFLLVSPPFRREKFLRALAKAVLLAALVTAPFFLWDAAAFIKSLVLFQIDLPFRPDALSYTALFARVGIWLPSWIGFVATIPVTALFLKRAPRTPSGFSMATALMFFSLFVLSQRAWCNYYFFVIGAMCCAIAVSAPENAASYQSLRGSPQSNQDLQKEK